MIKLNKCRTLCAFNDQILASNPAQTQGTQQSSRIDHTQQDKNYGQVNDTKNLDNKDVEKKESTSKDAQNINSKQAEEKKVNENNDNQNTPPNQTQQGENQTQYLSFEPDEFIITTFKYENGWWYGYKESENASTIEKLGFFPSNYVQVIEEYEQLGIHFAELFLT